MRIVLDTNVLLAALPRISPFRRLIDELAVGKINLVVSTAILLEYQEILVRKTNLLVGTNFLEFLLTTPGIIHVGTPFAWNLIEADADDNKFVDAGLIAQADYLVTFDRHFDVLKNHPFPHINVVDPDTFMTILAVS